LPEACPSFAEIGEAIESLLADGDEDYQEGTALSPQHQYMLAWCWNNIKVSLMVEWQGQHSNIHFLSHSSL